MMKIIIGILIIMSLAQVSVSQNGYNVKGHILNETTKEHVAYLSVKVKGTNITTASDSKGHFVFNYLKDGKIILVVSGMGYKTSEKEVLLQKDSIIDVKIEIKEDVLMTDEVVVTSNRNETNRKETPVIINLITPEMMDKTNSVCLAQSLNYQPGLRIENDCQNCGFQQVRINGLEGPYSQILIDSRSVFSTLAGVYGLEQIPVNMIDRVEIMRGGGSALYGSNAIAGTINIITKEPLYNTITLSNNLTSIGGKTPDNTFNLNGALVTEDRKAGISFFGMMRNRKPYFSDDDDFSEIGKIDQSTFGLKSYYKTSDYSKVSLEFHYINEFRRGGNLFEKQPHETDITEQTEHKIYGGSIDYAIFSKDLSRKLNAYTSIQTIKRDSYYGAGKDPNAYGKTDDITVVSGLQIMNQFKNFLFLPSEFTAGTEYLYSEMHDRMTGYERDIHQRVNIGGVFVQNEWKSQNSSLLLGFRSDKHNLIDNIIISPRANIRYTLANDYTFRVSYSTGYRAPQTFDEDLHVTAVGGNVILMKLADNLQPEYSKSVSGSIDIMKTLGNTGINFLIEGFYTKLDNTFILQEAGTDPSGNIILERRNGEGAIVQGLNFELKVVPSRWINFQAGFTLQRSKYTAPFSWSEDSSASLVDRLLRSPDAYGYLNLSIIPLNNLSLSIAGIYTGSMLVPHYAGYITSDRLETTEDFFNLNIKLSYDFSLSGFYSVQLFSGIENIFNSFQKDFDKGQYRDAGYIYGTSVPRSIFAGLKIGIL